MTVQPTFMRWFYFIERGQGPLPSVNGPYLDQRQAEEARDRLSRIIRVPVVVQIFEARTGELDTLVSEIRVEPDN